MDEKKIQSLDHYLQLLRDIYASPQGPNWDRILPYYHEDLYFRDSVQELRGIKAFTKMVRRLSRRSKNLQIEIQSSSMSQDVIFVEWEMKLSFQNAPKSSIFGVSKTRILEGKIVEQRDYYDLWGDILDNVPLIGKGYRLFMRKVFG